MITEDTLLPIYLRDIALLQTELTAIEQTELKGAALLEYEFSAMMRMTYSDAETAPAFGLLTHATGQEIIRVRLSNQTGTWSLIVENEGTAPAINCVLSLAKDFDPTAWHTLQLEQRDSQIHISLDDSLILSIIETTRITQPGLTTHNAAVEFKHIRQKALQ